MNAPHAVTPRDPFRREGQGPLQDPERPLLGLVVRELVLKVELTERTGGIPRGTTTPSDPNGVVTFGRPSTGDSYSQGSRPQPVNIPMPPGRLQTVTVVAGAPAFASMLQRPPPDRGM